jgi:hypothetical protein
MLLLDFAQPANTAANQNAATVGIVGLKVDTALPYRLVGRNHGELHKPVESLDLLSGEIEMLARIKVRNLTGKFHPEIGTIEARDPTDAALTGADIVPELGNLAPER